VRQWNNGDHCSKLQRLAVSLYYNLEESFQW
jgi:hypothetical protein